MKNATDITLLLDRSGSMTTMANDVVGGINTFVAKQKHCTADECLFTLIQFDSQNTYEVLYNGEPIENIREMQAQDFTPRGSTPLFDALGRTIVETGARLAKLPENERPNKVIVVVFTDGYENASRKYAAAQIREMVTHQTEKYNWSFVFLGAGIDAFAAGGDCGIAFATCADLSRGNSHAAYSQLSSKILLCRSGQYTPDQALVYSDAERQELVS